MALAIDERVLGIDDHPAPGSSAWLGIGACSASTTHSASDRLHTSASERAGRTLTERGRQGRGIPRA
ncbi:MAG TPA: hypothetical protein VLM79_23145 [Kofleriaceae bacterium]|nr:hypothetical protein [Kofleriaceae bacterium]